MLYELVTAKHPFGGANQVQASVRVEHGGGRGKEGWRRREGGKNIGKMRGSEGSRHG